MQRIRVTVYDVRRTSKAEGEIVTLGRQRSQAKKAAYLRKGISNAWETIITERVSPGLVVYNVLRTSNYLSDYSYNSNYTYNEFYLGFDYPHGGPINSAIYILQCRSRNVGPTM